MSQVVITYCKPCGYLKRAQAAAEALDTRLGIAPELVPGKGGVYRVTVDGQVVAAKSRQGFPDPDEIVEAVAASLT
ncbi:SelT/SelW/SelH family protein [Nocardia yunnanensis]|uniref:SelT/SelW/SelH family protein n=1 Tax=Nocardia yunnanensis TaxID=2382165 RepID=A0A386Z9D3_9NOCA|nr:Rdx family protein [Nocardia yunnanensis]AYF73773.1 SelT/SelW/SelH family protein [Nocardia yunnanensis]